MKPYLVTMPKCVQRLFPKRIWAFDINSNSVYLTFDDGPIPEVTPWVLAELKKYDAKATFFCIGDNIEKHPNIFKEIISEGHSVGNHTFNHLNGWTTNPETYVQNVIRAEATMQQFGKTQTQTSLKLFRPPYGKISSKQAKILQQKGYKIIMWNVLSADFDAEVSEEKCLQNILKNIHPGSIVVFHDSIKAKKNMEYALPRVLEFIERKGWKSDSISF